MKFRSALIAFTTAAALTACVDTPQAYTAVSQVRSAGAAVSTMNASGGLRVYTRPISASIGKLSDGHISFMNLGYSSETSDILFQTDVALGDSIPAQKIKQEGARVYTYVRPRFRAQKINHSRNEKYDAVERAVMTNEGFCDGYYVVLSPENGYRHTFRRSNPIEIRSRTTGMDVGWFGGSVGSENWEMTGIDENYYTLAELSLKPFRMSLRSRIFTPCYADAQTKALWR